MYREKKYVLGAVGAILRYLIMIPGTSLLLLGGIGSLLAVLGAGDTAGEAAEAKELTELRAEIIESGLFAAAAEDILEDGRYDGDKSNMNQEDLDLVREAEAKYRQFRRRAVGLSAAGRGGLAFFLTLSVILIVVGLVMVFLGFLVGIRKWKLVCDQCGAAVNAV
jgi:hypothetical protein